MPFQGETSQRCFDGDLCLDNSTTSSPPLVMICVQGQWGYVCGKKSKDSPWTKENIGVACQQMGYIREGMSRKKLNHILVH